MSKFDLVIFDCDGTLVDSETLANKALIDILAEAGFPQYTFEYSLANFMGLNLAKIWQKIEQENNTKLPPDITDRIIAHIDKTRAEMTAPAPGAAAFIEQVSKTHKICVASNGERHNVVESLRVTGLLGFFPDQTIFTAADVQNPKPAPDLFLWAAQKMGTDPTRAAVIEDSVAGATAGLAAKMKVFGYTGLSHAPSKQKELLHNIGIDCVVDHLSEIQGFLD